MRGTGALRSGETCSDPGFRRREGVTLKTPEKPPLSEAGLPGARGQTVPMSRGALCPGGMTNTVEHKDLFSEPFLAAHWPKGNLLSLSADVRRVAITAAAGRETGKDHPHPRRPQVVTLQGSRPKTSAMPKLRKSRPNGFVPTQASLCSCSSRKSL